jgi:glycosyltransferase involved in cell wall biosynthesis
VPISLIFTVLNESQALPRLLDSIAAQTRQPDEIVVVDGGSTDGTLDVLNANAKRLPLKIISQPGANISQGRNTAIRAATGDIICSTDAGVRLDELWVEELVKQFDERLQSSSVDVVSGFFTPDPQNVFEIALAATTLPALADIQPEKFLPSSRSIAFTKSAWEAAGGYPEWLDFCEDLIFDFELRKRFQFAFAPKAVAHFRPRSNLRSFFKQYYQYSRGDGKANLWFKRHLIRYLTYLVALPLALALLFFAPLLGFGILLLGFVFMFFTPYKRLVPMMLALSSFDQATAIAWVPIIRVTGDIAKMIGYPVGIVWRVKKSSISRDAK